jgi:hypothetical protein
MRITIGVAIALVGACGGSQKPAPPVVHEEPKPPAPPPVCVRAGAEMSAIGSASADAASAHFCVSDGSDTNQCFALDLAGGALSRLAGPGPAQAAALGDAHARVETTATEVKVCATADDCKTFKPSLPKSAENPLEARANAAGTIAVVMMGDAEAGKGTAEVWDVAKGKKLSSIRYASGDYKCGHARVLGDTIFVSADVCSGPAAHAALYTTKGKKLADVGGKDFGTYGEEPVQVKDDEWAFLEENGEAIALQDVKTGKVAKTIDIGVVWAPPDASDAPPGPAPKGGIDEPTPPVTRSGDAPAPAMGNPGESVLVRGGDGQLVVITGGPSPGNAAIVDVESGAAKVLHAKACK